MHEVTQVLLAIGQGDPQAPELLLPLVYDELRRLAAERLAQERPGQTLEATALVHEAYLRLVGAEKSRRWDGRGHFFAAAAEAMRRILVDQARNKHSLRRGGGLQRHTLEEVEIGSSPGADIVLAVHEALARFERLDRVKAELVKLRYF
ncbi:MAG: ECF-type sigma factor, partial [Pirellulaceae bacterium]|nr:ECF-type sigma factor [Pirellulaceae bacterium]